MLIKDFATVLVNRPASMLQITWHRQTTEEEFKEAYMLGIQAAKKDGLRYFLSDNSVGINLVIALQHWVQDYGSGILKNLVLERYARVVPMDPMHEIVSYKMYDYLSQDEYKHLEFKVFYTREEALQWLMNGSQQCA